MIKITQVAKYFVVDIGDNRIHMLNERALTWFLKNQVKLKPKFVAAIIKTFATQAVVEIDLSKVA